MSDPVSPRRRLGTAGEGHARRFLEALGYRFAAAQWRGAGCEIDLIMWDGDELVFVEVKARRGEDSGRAAEAVSARQTKALVRAATTYVEGLSDEGQAEPIWRFDLVAVTLDRSGRVRDVTHVENALVIDF